MTYTLYQFLGFFLIYAFAGWCAEVCFAALTTGEVVNRGFLNGPVCPIYGVGMVGVLLLLTPVADNLFLLFLLGLILCSVIELVGGYILKKVFDTRWWDYTDRPFNIGGYVCLSFSILWGLAVVFIVRLVHPAVAATFGLIPHVLGWVLMAVCYAAFIADFVITLITIIGLKKKLGELERIAEALHAISDPLSEHLGASTLAADARFDEARELGQEKLAEGRQRFEDAMESGQEKLAESRQRFEDALESRQEKLAEGRQKLEDAVESGQEKLELQRQRLELQREKLEQRRKDLLRSIRSSSPFGSRRLSGAFPSLRAALRERIDRLEHK